LQERTWARGIPEIGAGAWGRYGKGMIRSKAKLRGGQGSDHQPRRSSMPNESTPAIGIDESDLKGVNSGLATVLADTFTLYLKTHGYHWNVTGPHFRSLHLMFEEQYNALFAATDELAE